jgi:hypothetical protein
MEWLTHAVLLTTAHKTKDGIVLDQYWPPARPHPPVRAAYPYDLGPDPPEESQRMVLRLDVHAPDEGGRFDILESGEKVLPMCVTYDPQAMETRRPIVLGYPHCLSAACR